MAARNMDEIDMRPIMEKMEVVREKVKLFMDELDMKPIVDQMGVIKEKVKVFVDDLNTQPIVDHVGPIRKTVKVFMTNFTTRAIMGKMKIYEKKATVSWERATLFQKCDFVFSMCLWLSILLWISSSLVRQYIRGDLSPKMISRRSHAFFYKQFYRLGNIGLGLWAIPLPFVVVWWKKGMRAHSG